MLLGWWFVWLCCFVCLGCWALVFRCGLCVVVFWALWVGYCGLGVVVWVVLFLLSSVVLGWCCLGEFGVGLLWFWIWIFGFDALVGWLVMVLCLVRLWVVVLVVGLGFDLVEWFCFGNVVGLWCVGWWVLLVVVNALIDD